MTNAKKFNKSFGMYATELWAMPEEKFLKWLNCEQKQTNADLIRAMTDEELAELLTAYKCVDCILFSRDCKVEETLGSGKTCEERILDWLREEAE